ncbi:MAG: flagellar hook-basal body complex protein FliE [Thermoplasmata archaeon]|nr:flagellar hook-basal body complex protein FliE [Thermoplasmata archaeon]MCI4359241.1 flagellar hook-basal body complex protein FliE [Thermoplasmata archaeon]
MKLIVSVGMPGSGKDELLEIAGRLGLATLKMGDLVRDETRRRGFPINNANIARVANEEREKHGPGVWAQRAVPKLIETKMLVDGCRSDAEVTVFRHHFGDLFVLGIYSAPETRYERLIRRARGDDGQNLQEFYDRDRRELKWGIGNAFTLADGMLTNEGTLEEFRTAGRTMLERILSRES